MSVTQTTLAAMQSGSPRLAFVVAIDGYPHLFSNESESAIQAAWSATDWAAKSVIGGLILELDNHQQLNPWEPFSGGGRVVLRVQPDADDTFGVDVSRTDAGAETMLTQTATRTSTLFVGFADGFDFTGEAHCGTECFSYGFVGGGGLHVPLGQQVGSNRGKYVAHGVKNSATMYGAVRFSEHHRVATQDNGVRFAPIVSVQPRSWKGRRVSVWAHVVDPSTGELNSKANALCLFVGEFSEAQDESDTGHTTILVENILDKIPKMTLVRDQWSATVDYGMQLKAGQKFKFQDFDGTAARDATDLTVIASGSSGTNQVDEGYYGPEEIASIINAWLAGETGAGRIKGNYTLRSPEDVNGSPRSVWHVYMPGATSTQFWYKITWPIVGWATALGMPGAFTLAFNKCGAAHVNVSGSEVKPFDFTGTDSGGTFQIKLEAQVGIFQGQNATLPAGARWFLNHSPLAGDSNRQYGLFLLECENPLVLLATVENNKLRYIRVLTTSFSYNFVGYDQLMTGKVPLGSGPPRIRQIFVHEAPMRTMMKWLFYSTGSGQYNSEWDVLPHGQGLSIPYDMLGDEFEASCNALPGADDIITVVLDKPRRVDDVFRADLVVRNAHVAWREGGIRFVSWSSPASAIVTTTLDESNKAEPIDSRISHRSASVLDSSWVKNFVKINYNRDISKSIGGGEDIFLAPPLEYEDATSIDDAGGVPTAVTLDLRNVYNDTDQIGQGVRQLASGLVGWLTLWSRPLWKVRRSIAPTHYEGFGIGDCVAVTDPFVRDPTSGLRGIETRAGLVVGHRYQIQTAPAPDKIKFAGEVDIVFLHNDRTFAYSPCAEVDETANTGGFTAGYDGARTLQFKAHEHSLDSSAVDVSGFAEGDGVTLIEIDPNDPAVVDYWDDEVTFVDAATNRITLINGPVSPAFSASKRYRLVYGKYNDTQGSQHIKSFQAGTNKTIGETSPPDVYGSQPLISSSADVPTEYDHTTLPELLANVSYGPNLGRSRDCGYDKELALLLDNMMDHHTRQSSSAIEVSAGSSLNQTNSPGWKLLRVEMIHIGNLIYGSEASRYLWLAPQWQPFLTGLPTPIRLRVWLSGYPPSGTGFFNLDGQEPGYTIKAPAAGNEWSHWSASVSVSDWINGVPQAYPLGNFNGHEYVFAIVEGTYLASCIGLCQVSEGERFDS